jgi:hypothetical protein
MGNRRDRARQTSSLPLINIQNTISVLAWQLSQAVSPLLHSLQGGPSCHIRTLGGGGLYIASYT